MIVVIVAASMLAGVFTGYQIGYQSLQRELTPEVQRLSLALQNTTAENDALRKDIPSISGRTVKIGYIAPTTDPYPIPPSGTIMPAYSTAKPFIEKVIQPDLDAYAASLGRDVRFEFVLMDAKGQANTHLELVQQLKSMGVNIFIGGGWSSQADSAMSYVKTSNMLMMSPSSTSPNLAVAGDRFFRMCPADGALGPALASVIWSFGVKEVVIIQRGDSWGDGLVGLLVPKFTSLGGLAGQKIRYPAEATDFREYLQQANVMAEEAIAREGSDRSRVGVLLLAYDEAATILKQVSQYDVLYNLTWFGGDATAKSLSVAEGAPLEANHLKLFSPLARAPDSALFRKLGERFVEATGTDFSVYYANLYDTAFVLVRTILETGSDNATEVTAALPGVCESTYGASGWLRLNEYGDRAPPPFDIWYYSSDAKPGGSQVAGVYDPETGTVVWYTNRKDTVIGS
jgi:branched-chain amino acid transport system substrate-binding protein